MLLAKSIGWRICCYVFCNNVFARSRGQLLKFLVNYSSFLDFVACFYDCLIMLDCYVDCILSWYASLQQGTLSWYQTSLIYLSNMGIGAMRK